MQEVLVTLASLRVVVDGKKTAGHVEGHSKPSMAAFRYSAAAADCYTIKG